MSHKLANLVKDTKSYHGYTLHIMLTNEVYYFKNIITSQYHHHSDVCTVIQEMNSALFKMILSLVQIPWLMYSSQWEQY